ncbi:MAG: DNA polymerase/3'-5' exonuclease PolX [Phycisphaeraceae bacterium]|nr:DNA polymerase/3'-5' exonuclease PolX [Phycisphaerales bacterium]MCB9859019.1 DNA polymerase/3'-5' exonuclease PolX [Phycisphaeraceae bacterium]
MAEKTSVGAHLTNKDIAETFEHLAKLMTLIGVDKFRVAATDRAARSIEQTHTPVASLIDKRDSLLTIEGIGAKTADKIIELVTTGKIEELDELKGQVPDGVVALMDIPGLGPKTVSALWKDLKVESIDDLKTSIESGSIMNLPRMGKKTVDNIKDAIEHMQAAGHRLPIGLAMPIAERVMDELRKVKGVEQITCAGSLRRGAETIGDIDILVATKNPEPVHEAFTTMDGVIKVLASGETKSSVRLDGEVNKYLGLSTQMQVDLRTLAPEHWGAALMYFTGSKNHNIRLREIAQRHSMKLNDYGLYKDDENDTPPQQRGVKPVASKTEDEVYKALGVPWIPPELREDLGETKWTKQTDVPDLIELDDIKTELHAHTTWSDGSMSMEELVTLYLDRGFHTIAVTDHSKSQVQANGLNAERLVEQRKEIETNRKHFGKKITILHGSEVDILTKGELDFPDDVLQELDIVVASPHAALTQKPNVATKRLIKAIEHPLVHIIGHPTGRLVGKRKGLEPAMNEIIAAAVENNVALEINAHWRRLDLRDIHVRMAVEAGALIAIDCDTHIPKHADNLRYGIFTARRGGLSAKNCINTWPAKKLHAWLKSKR